MPSPVVERVVETVLPTRHGTFRLVGYRGDDGTEHVCRSTTSNTFSGGVAHEPAEGERHHGVRFTGPNGWIYVTRGKLEASDPKLIDDPLPADAGRLREGRAGREPALFVHGLGGSSQNWSALMAALAGTVAGEALDLPGFGHSPPPDDGNFSLAAQARAVVRLLDGAPAGEVIGALLARPLRAEGV